MKKYLIEDRILSSLTRLVIKDTLLYIDSLKEVIVAEKEVKRGLFGQAINALSSKDEKEALELAQKQLAEAQATAEKYAKELAALKATGTQASSQTASAIAQANKRAEEAEKKMKELQAQIEKLALMQEMEKKKNELDEKMKARLEAAAPKVITEHTLTSEETLSHLSLKYYGSATKPYWMVIYEANKDVVGDNPNRVRSGMVLKIPELPANLKKKK